ncbi:hypothetical protein C0J52_04943 [Blattella germanica]|nr:hypothetical protein C0J52_04943 [Blattella germanica]
MLVILVSSCFHHFNIKMLKFTISNPTKVRLLYAVSFLDLFACSMVIPLLSPHLRSLGASHFTIGCLSSLYAGLQLVSGPVIALCRTLLADLVPAKDQLATQSRLVSFAAVGFIIGPAIGGHLAEVEGGFFYICFTVMLFFWLNYAIVCLFFCEPSTSDKGTQTVNPKPQNARRPIQRFSSFEKTNIRNHLSVINSSTKKVYTDASQVVKNLSHVDWSVYWDVFALKFLLAFGLAVHFQNFSLMLKDKYDVSPKWIGYAISLQGLVSATTGFTTNWVSSFYSHDKSNLLRTLHGFLALTGAFILLSIAPSLIYVLLFLIPLSAAGSVLRITTSEIILQRTEPHQRGSLIGSGESISSTARLLAPLCSGIAYDNFGFHGISVLKIVPAASGIVLANFLFVQQQKEKTA